LLSNQVDMPARWTYSVGSALYGAGINYVFFHYGTVGMPPSIQQLAVVTWISTLVVLFWIGWGVGGQLDSKPYTRTS